MHDRIIDELQVLKTRFPAVEHGPDWVLVPDFPLPAARFNKLTTRVLFRIPPGYPNTGPDDFFVDADLRLCDGTLPPALNQGGQSSSGPAPVDGDWSWFSWHPAAWRPAAIIEVGDNLMTFLRGVSMCLRGEEAP